MRGLRRRRGGFTLLELLVVMSLVGLIGVGFSYLYANSQRFLAQSMAITATQGEASFALEHIKRQLLPATEVTVPAVGATATQLTFEVPGAAAAPVVSQYALVGQELQYTPDMGAAGTAEVIARNITVISFTRDNARRITVNVTAQQTAPDGDTRSTQLRAVIGLKGIF